MIRFTIRTFLPFLFIILYLTSCDLINPSEGIPAYLNIDTIKLSTNLVTEGSAVHKITDAWVYINGSLNGVYELPATFPVLATGNVKINIYPGIKNNGIDASRVIYPFYTDYEITTILEENKITTLNPKVNYKTAAVFSWIEDFEDAGISLDTTGKSASGIQQVEMNHSLVGSFLLNYDQEVFECKTVDAFELPQNNSVYLEMEYKCDANFVVGLFINKVATIIQQPVMTVFPIENWNKIYIDLSYYTTTNTNAIDYNVFLGVLKTDSTKTAQVYVDNLKLIHF